MTIEDMARELGVSKSTISRALSGKGRIGNETKEKICEYAEKHGFTPRAGRNRNVTKTCNIAVVLPGDAYITCSPFFQEGLLGVCEAANQMDYNIVVTTSTGSDISRIKYLVENAKVDGVILTREMENDKAIKYLTEMNIPTGIMGIVPNDKVLQVGCDNRAAAENLTSMLLSSGYRKFAVLLETTAFRVNRRRLEGIMEAWEKAGISKEQQLVYNVHDQMEFLDNLIVEIMNKKVECIICGDDVICTKVISKLQADGYRIPKNISIASLYNSSNLNCFSPAVTTVNVSAKAIGNIAAKQLINCLNGNEYQQKIYVDYEILFRKSTPITWKNQEV